MLPSLARSPAPLPRHSLHLTPCCLLLRSAGSTAIINFGAWFSCHARERLRRRYQLPPTFGLPPGLDDCLVGNVGQSGAGGMACKLFSLCCLRVVSRPQEFATSHRGVTCDTSRTAAAAAPPPTAAALQVHFLCFYCASHQEVRELAVRGVDGPGMHILDVLPHSFDGAEGEWGVELDGWAGGRAGARGGGGGGCQGRHGCAPAANVCARPPSPPRPPLLHLITDPPPLSHPPAGIEEAKAERRRVLEAMLARPPRMFKARQRAAQQQQLRSALSRRMASTAVALAQGLEGLADGDDLPVHDEGGGGGDKGGGDGQQHGVRHLSWLAFCRLGPNEGAAAAARCLPALPLSTCPHLASCTGRWAGRPSTSTSTPAAHLLHMHLRSSSSSSSRATCPGCRWPLPAAAPPPPMGSSTTRSTRGWGGAVTGPRHLSRCSKTHCIYLPPFSCFPS